MESGKRHDTTDARDFCRANLLRTCRLCCGLTIGETGVMDFVLTRLVAGIKRNTYNVYCNITVSTASNWSAVDTILKTETGVLYTDYEL